DCCHAPAAYECFAGWQNFWPAGQRPNGCNRPANLETQPIRDPVADGGADGGPNPDRPKIEIAGPDERANGDERSPRRRQTRDDAQRFSKGERKCKRSRPGLMHADEFDGLLRIRIESLEHAHAAFLVQYRPPMRVY